MEVNKLYLEKLKDKRWKNKARKIVHRDGYKCTACGSKKKLEVHHTFYYEDYRNPWEYPNESLITVCKICHRDYHEHHEIEIRPVTKIKPKNKKPAKRKDKKTSNYDKALRKILKSDMDNYIKRKDGTWIVKKMQGNRF